MKGPSYNVLYYLNGLNLESYWAYKLFIISLLILPG